MSPPANAKVLVLLSGGLDSAVCLAWALDKGYTVTQALFIDYGQKALAAETRAVQALTQHYQVPLNTLSLPWLSSLLPKALQSQQKTHWQPVTCENLSDSVAQVWVPNRNGLFLNIAACLAEAQDAQHILFGANADEGEGFPDNTPAFRQAITAAMAYSTQNALTVLAPLESYSKSDIRHLAESLKVPVALTWSCYEAGPAPCGQCSSCQYRNR